MCTSFDALAQIMAMLVENVNMQINAEEQDLKDKRKIMLLGMKEGPITKNDMHGSPVREQHDNGYSSRRQSH